MYFEKSFPEDQGISTLAIKNFLTNIKKANIELHSYMIIRHSKIIDEGYFYPYAKDIEHMMYSISKTFVSLAIGFLIDENKLKLDDFVIPFFKEIDFSNKPYFNQLKIKHLLSMTTGIKEEPNFLFNSDWIKTYFNMEIIHTPGTVFKYINMNSYILSVIICRISGETLIDFLYQRLFVKLDIEKPSWDKCPKGYEVGGWGLFLKTEDLAKVTDLLLHDGSNHYNITIIPEFWIRELLTYHVDTSKHTNKQKDYLNGYSYGLWRGNDKTSFRLDGIYGQFAFVFKELNVVIVTTASYYLSYKIIDLIFEDLIPYFIDETLSFHADYYRQLMHLNKDLSLIKNINPYRSTYEIAINNITYHFKRKTIGFIPFMIQGSKGSFNSGPNYFRLTFFSSYLNIIWHEYNQEINLSAGLKNEVLYHDIKINQSEYRIGCYAYFENNSRLIIIVYFLSYPHSRKIVIDFYTSNRCLVSFIEVPDINLVIDYYAKNIMSIRYKKINYFVLESLYSLIDRSSIAFKK